MGIFRAWLLILAAAAVCLRTGTAASSIISAQDDAAPALVLDDSTALVATLDGALHAIDLNQGSLRWTFISGTPLVSVFAHESVERLIPSSLDGSLFSFDGEKLQRVGIDIQELVNRAPSVNEDHAWTGSKSARLFLLDLATGDLLRELSSGFMTEPESFPANTILIGRSDYSLQGADRFSPCKRQLWNMSFSSFIADAVMDSADDPHPFTISSEFGSTIVARSKKSESEILWELTFASMPVNLFRVQHLGNSASMVQVRDFFEKSKIQVSRLLLDAGLDRSSNHLEPRPLISDGRSDTRLSSLLLSATSISAPVPRCRWSGASEIWLVSVITVGMFLVLFLFFAILGTRVVHLLPNWLVTKKPKKSKKKRPLSTNFLLKHEPTTPVPKIILTARVLGYGSGGTIVYEGLLDGRRIAVKRMLKEFFSLAERETEILMHGDSHPNVVSYFLREEDSEFVYLALSRGCTTLAGVFDRDGDVDGEEGTVRILDPEARIAVDKARSDVVKLLRGIVLGVAHLHSLGIVHRDLKPHNVLIDPAGCPQISDMGLARKLEHLQHSFSTASCGTQGWQAPEVMLLRDMQPNGGEAGSRIRISMAVDVWGIGCLIYYTLSGGHHPFGPRMIRESNIVKGNASLLHLLHDLVAMDLVSQCLQTDPLKRPRLQEVSSHPFFWDAHTRLLFLMDVSDLLESLESDIVATESFERVCANILPGGKQWTQMISPLLLENLGRYRRYSNSIKDLLRVIRNKSHHYRDLSHDLRVVLGGSHPTGFLQYFCQLFPRLFLSCYTFVASSNYRTDAAFARYFV